MHTLKAVGSQELKEMERDLRSLMQQLRSEGRLTTRVEHDLRNALAIVVLYQETMLSDGADPEIWPEIDDALGRGQELISSCATGLAA